jgi:hypothetical protein
LQIAVCRGFRRFECVAGFPVTSNEGLMESSAYHLTADCSVPTEFIAGLFMDAYFVDFVGVAEVFGE